MLLEMEQQQATASFISSLQMSPFSMQLEQQQPSSPALAGPNGGGGGASVAGGGNGASVGGGSNAGGSSVTIALSGGGGANSSNNNNNNNSTNPNNSNSNNNNDNDAVTAAAVAAGLTSSADADYATYTLHLAGNGGSAASNNGGANQQHHQQQQQQQTHQHQQQQQHQQHHQQHHQQQQQQQQHYNTHHQQQQQQQQQQNIANNPNFSYSYIYNFDSQYVFPTGYQDNTSSHSQQSGSGGGGGGGSGGSALLNGVVGGSMGNATAGSYMSLLPSAGTAATSSGGHGGMGSAPGGTSASSGPNNGGGGGGGGPSGASGATTGEGIDFKHLFEELCPVCGDKVSGYHYGLLTCESCKGFFKRTVQNKKVYTCVAERSCHIDKTQRKRCPYCRFQKCLEVGMKLEAVRADRMRGGRNKFGPMYKRDRARKLQVMRQRQLALQALRTSMGSVEMKTTPLSPGYQQAYPNMNIKQEIQIPQVSSLTQSPDSSPSPIAIALGQVNANAGVINAPMHGNNGGGGGVGGSSGVGGGGGGGGVGGGGGGGGGGGNNGNNNGPTSDIITRGNNSNCHDAGNGSLQNAADSKMCFDSATHPSSTADSMNEPLRVSPMIREFVQSIDDREWQTQLFALLQKQTYNQVEVDLFELMCKVLDQNLFSQVDWARNTVFFKDLKVDDQMKLLQHSWSDMLVLDHLHQRIHNGLPDETQLNNGQMFNLLWLGLLGVPQLADYFNELQNKLQDLKFDMGDYVCMKFLILLNPEVRGIINKKTVLEGHENVQAALLDYTLTCYPSVTDKFRRLLNILPDIHAMAARGEEHLYSKHCAGSAPTQTLLMEMLHAKRKV